MQNRECEKCSVNKYFCRNIDNKSGEIISNLNSYYYKKVDIDMKFDDYYNKSYINNLDSYFSEQISSISGSFCTLKRLFCSPLEYTTYPISNVPNLSFTDTLFNQTVPTIQINLSEFTDIGLNDIGLKLINLNFYIYTDSSNKNAMKDLICTVNKYPSKPIIGSFNKPILIGTIEDETKFYAKYSFNEITNYGFDSSIVYLHFFFENDSPYSNPSFTLDNNDNMSLQIDIHKFTQN